jgi:cytochrome c oxidase accessory protein FixG
MKPSTNDANNTVKDLYVSAEKIYPRQVKGIFARWRILTVFLLLGCYYITPWLQWNDRQAVLFDLPARQFHYFGITFWPQDFIFLTLLLIICAVGLFLFTTIAGRLWCGYACPQTVWTEVFFWIEEKIEGNRNQRIKLDQSPWNAKKIIKKTTKHFFWGTFSLYTGYTFVGYFTPIHDLGTAIIYWTLSPWEYFWLALYSLATYGNAGWLKEQVCLYMCPYARFQSVMFDQDTLIISYDEKRGESRGKRKKQSDYQSKGLGDCIDCQQCVQVCPTGIDIRDGLQYECIACAACIDVCDNVMEKMNYPKGLIRYTTQTETDALDSQPSKKSFIRPKMLIYMALFLGLLILFVYGLSQRIPLDINVIRERSTLFTESFSGDIENIYTLRILNMSQKNNRYRLSVSGFSSMQLKGKKEFSLLSGKTVMIPVRVSIPKQALLSRVNDIIFKVEVIQKKPSKQHIIMDAKKTFAKFLGPQKVNKS